jgi:hypothetical protein
MILKFYPKPYHVGKQNSMKIYLLHIHEVLCPLYQTNESRI